MIIDSHTHVLPGEFRTDKERFLQRDSTFRALFSSPRAETASAESLLEEMDRNSIEISVIAGYGWTDFETARVSNDYLLSAGQASHGRLVPLCSVNPIWGRDAVDEIRRCHDAGAKGIGELHPDSQGFLNSDFASLNPFFATARELGMPILVHASEPVGHSYPGKGTVTPELSLALAQAFPSNVIVFAHFGGGLPLYSLMPEVRRDLKNVYFDSAAFPFLYEPGIFDACVSASGQDRIMFASDYPVVSQKRALKEFHESAIGADDDSPILARNARNVWKID